MDLTLARTFLIIVETGSFIDAARKMHVTQSTISARVKSLEDQLGRPLFQRGKTGATLTAAGEQFQKHALALVRVWQQARLEVGLSGEHRDHLAVGALPGLWEDFLLGWLAWMRQNIADIAVSATAGTAATLTQRLLEGTLDLAVMYRPTQPPGLATEHLFDEELVLVSSAKRGAAEYVFANWGPDFQSEHAAAFPDLTNPALNLDIGGLGIAYLLSCDAQGYFPRRLVQPHVERGRLKMSRRARRFVYPVYMVYPEARDEEAYEPILEGLRKAAARLS